MTTFSRRKGPEVRAREAAQAAVETVSMAAQTAGEAGHELCWAGEAKALVAGACTAASDSLEPSVTVQKQRRTEAEAGDADGSLPEVASLSQPSVLERIDLFLASPDKSGAPQRAETERSGLGAQV